MSAFRRGQIPSHPTQVEPLEPRRLLAAQAAVETAEPVLAPDPPPPVELTYTAHVRFAPEGAPPVEGYLVDSGAAFGDRGNALAFGWDRGDAAKVKTRQSRLATDPRYDSFAAAKPDAAWEIAVPTGTYAVRLSVGDPKGRRAAYALDVEDQPALRGAASAAHRWVEATAVVTVSDGKLTLTSPGRRFKNKINFIDIVPAPLSPVPQVSDWRRGAPSPIARAEAVGAAVGGRLFVFGGIHGRGKDFAFPVTARSDVYDPAKNRWSTRRVEAPGKPRDSPREQPHGP